MPSMSDIFDIIDVVDLIDSDPILSISNKIEVR